MAAKKNSFSEECQLEFFDPRRTPFRLLIINSKAMEKDKIKIFVQALRRFDLEQIYIKPAIRALLDGRDCL